MADETVTKKDLTDAVEMIVGRVEVMLVDFQRNVEARFTSIYDQFSAIDGRFTAIDARFTAIDARFTAIDARFTAIDARFSEFEKNIIGHMDENFATKQELAALEERLNEKIHDTETRLLRGYEYHARATESHLKTLDAQTAANFLAQGGYGLRISDLETQMREFKNPPPPQ